MTDVTDLLVAITATATVVVLAVHISETVKPRRLAATVRRNMNPARIRLLILALLVVTVCAIATLVDGMRSTAPAPTVPTPTTSTAPPTTVERTTLPHDTVETSTTSVETLPVDEFVGRCEWWRPVLLWVGFPEWELETADRILYAESRCDNSAVNLGDWGGGSWCAFQIHRPSHEDRLLAEGLISRWEELVEDPFACAAAALTVYQRAGNSWSPWSTY